MHEIALTNLFKSDAKLSFFDIGSCEGLSNLRYPSMFKKATIHALDPVPKNFKLVLEKKNNLQNF